MPRDTRLTVDELRARWPALAREFDQAEQLYREFSGHRGRLAGQVEAPKTPRVAIVVGYCDGILYSAVRDGEVGRYIHQFKRSARPLFLVTPDGRQLILYGGAFDFTERGIVDR